MSEPTSQPTSQPASQPAGEPTSSPAPKRRRAKAAAPAPVVEAPAPAPAPPPAPAPVAAEPPAEPTAKPARKSSKKAAPAPVPEPTPAVEPAPAPPAEPVPAIPVVVEVLAAPAPAAVIDRLYHELMALTRQADLLLAVGVGRLLIDRLYGGDFSSWRTRARKDDASLRALAAKFRAADVLGFSTTNLYRAIAVTELVEKLGGLPGVERRRLGLGHYRAVLGVEGAQQVKLLDRAEAKGWSAERLAAEVARLRKKKGERRGRPPLPGFVKTLNHLQRILEDEDDAFADLDAVDALDAAEATRLYDAATAMKEKCEALQAALRGKARGDG